MLSCPFNRARAVPTVSAYRQWPAPQASQGLPRSSALAALALRWDRTSLLQSAHTKKRARNSFPIRTYKSLDLKSPGMNTYKKYRGVGPLRLLQMLDLVRISHCQRRIKASSSMEVPLSSSVSAYSISSAPAPLSASSKWCNLGRLGRRSYCRNLELLRWLRRTAAVPRQIEA